ncbi:unnamed protein product, partial [Tilletia caries]
EQTTIPYRSEVIQIKTTNPFNTANASTITQTSIFAVAIITTVTIVVKFVTTIVTVTVIATAIVVTVVVTVINPPFAKQVLALSTPFPTLAKVIVAKIVVVPWFHMVNPSLSNLRITTTNFPIPCTP